MTCTIKLWGPLPLAAPAGEAAAAAAAAAGAASLLAGPDVATSAAVGLEGGVTKGAGAPCGVAGTEAVAADEWEGLPSASATMRPALRERMPLVNSRLNSDFLGCGLPASLPRLRAPSASPRPISRPAESAQEVSFTCRHGWPLTLLRAHHCHAHLRWACNTRAPLQA